MRRVMLLALSVLMVVSMAVSPAFAHDRDGDCWDEDDHFWSCDRDRHDGKRHHDGNRHRNNADVCFVYVFVPFGLDRKEHTSELQSRQYLVCRLLLEKKKKIPLRS